MVDENVLLREADEHDRRADALRAKVDILETEIGLALQDAGLEKDSNSYKRVMALLSQHGLTARDWGVHRAHADNYAVQQWAQTLTKEEK